MVLMTLSVSVVPSHDRKAVFFAALYILAVGEGGHKPCVQTFAADQFDEDLPEEKTAKSSFFNWWYMGIVLGSTAGVLLVIYIQDNVGWTAGALVLAGAVAAALVVFLIGAKRYRQHEPIGSPYTQVAQVVVAAVKKRHLREAGDGRDICCRSNVDNDASRPRTERTLARTSRMRFLDKAMIIDGIDESSNRRDPWRLCSLNQIEEVKLVFQLIPIWLSCIMFTVVQSQAHTFFIKQGSTMIRSVGGFLISPAWLQGILGLTILAATLAYDRLFVPAARKLTGHPSGIPVLRRIGIGLFISIVYMVVAGLVEVRRIRIAADHGLRDNPKATVPMSIFWLLPQCMLCGVSDAFTVVGLQELFYDQVPGLMRSMGAAAYLSVLGAGSFVSSGIIAIVQAITARNSGHKWLGDNLNTAHLDRYYWVLAALSALSFGVYLLIANRFEYKKVEEADELCYSKETSLKSDV